jgi:hypothetical protein
MKNLIFIIIITFLFFLSCNDDNNIVTNKYKNNQLHNYGPGEINPSNSSNPYDNMGYLII